MGVSMVDGTVEEAVVRRQRGNMTMFRTLRFRSDEGTHRTLTNAVVRNTIAGHLVPGTHARFYLFTALDIKGVHGIRTDDGTAACDFPSNNLPVFLTVAIINLVLLVGILAVSGGGLALLPLGLVILSAVGYYFTASAKREAQAQFDRDIGYRAPSTAAATAAVAA